MGYSYGLRDDVVVHHAYRCIEVLHQAQTVYCSNNVVVVKTQMGNNRRRGSIGAPANRTRRSTRRTESKRHTRHTVKSLRRGTGEFHDSRSARIDGYVGLIVVARRIPQPV